MQHFKDFFRNTDSVRFGADELLLRIRNANIGFIPLEARLQPNIGNTLRPVLMLFTCSGITQTKVNRFG